MLPWAWCRLGLHKFADLSNEGAASIFRMDANGSMLLRYVNKLLSYFMTSLAIRPHYPVTSNFTIMNVFEVLKTHFISRIFG